MKDIIEWLCKLMLAVCFLGACGFFGIALFNALTSHNEHNDNEDP